MRVNRILIGGVVLVAALAIAGASYQSWKGMLQAAPAQLTLSNDARRLKLTGFRECDVVVEGLPNELKGSMTREDIEGWTAIRLKNMGLRVVSQGEKNRAFFAADMSTDEKALAATDRFSSVVGVNVNAVRSSSGALSVGVVLACYRGVFVQPGYFTEATVWHTGSIMYFTSHYEAKDKTRDTLNKHLDTFEKDWKKCNP